MNSSNAESPLLERSTIFSRFVKRCTITYSPDRLIKQIAKILTNLRSKYRSKIVIHEPTNELQSGTQSKELLCPGTEDKLSIIRATSCTHCPVAFVLKRTRSPFSFVNSDRGIPFDFLQTAVTTNPFGNLAKRQSLPKPDFNPIAQYGYP